MLVLAVISTSLTAQSERLPPYTLLGVIAGGPSSNPVAVLRREGETKSLFVSIGSQIPGTRFQVTRIGSKEVDVAAGNVSFRIFRDKFPRPAPKVQETYAVRRPPDSPHGAYNQYIDLDSIQDYQGVIVPPSDSAEKPTIPLTPFGTKPPPMPRLPKSE